MATSNSASTQILREYLVSLGYRVNRSEQRVFDDMLDKTHIRVGRLGATVLGVVTGTAVMVHNFAKGMETMYYSALKADSTINTLRALDFGARSVGLGAGSMTAALEGMARSIRSNPGLQGLIESFGIKVTGRDMGDVALDLLETLRKMPFYLGSQYAGLFGIDPDTYLLLTKGLETLRAAAEVQKKAAADMKVDLDQAAQAAREYAQAFRTVTMYAGLLSDKISIALLPNVKELSGVMSEVLKDWARIMDTKTFGDVVNDLAVQPAKSLWGKFLEWGGAKGYKKPGVNVLPHPGMGTTPSADLSTMSATEGDPESMLNALEVKYGLPKGLLWKVWTKESARGKHMRSPKGAMGHFQFMPKTAKEWGVTDPDNLENSADGAARYLRHLFNKYDGDAQHALAAYNWGMGNVDRFGLSKAPAETRDYVNSISGKPIVIQPQTSITVQGSSDPAATARAVAAEQNAVNANLGAVIRNHLGAVQ